MGNNVSQAGCLDVVQVYCYLKTLTTPGSLKCNYWEKLYAISSFISNRHFGSFKVHSNIIKALALFMVTPKVSSSMLP